MPNTLTGPVGRLVEELEGLESSKRFTEEQLETVYALGHSLYASGKYEEALRYFAFLTLYRPIDAKFLRGLAATQQMAKQYEAAIQVYSFLTLLDPHDPTPTLRIGECLMMMGETEQAREAFSMVADLARLGGADAPLGTRAKGLIDVLDKAQVTA
jgi:type III secretion system low calcium response chaperone LcrH/SycD